MSGWLNSAEIPQGKATVFLCGGTRSGKTEICTTFPNPIFIFPKNENSKATIRGRGFPYKEVGSMGELDAILEELQIWGQRGELTANNTVCLESLSHYADIVLAEIQKQYAPKDGRQLWGRFGDHFARMRTILTSLPCNVVFTALDRKKTDNDQSIIAHDVQLGGREGGLLPASCDIVAFTEQLPINPPRWRAHVQQYGHFRAGTRLRGMPHGVYDNFNYPEHIKPYL